MRYLIVNADDYGMTPAVSRGIRDAHERGIVTSTTVMIGMPSADEGVRTAQRDTPTLGLGLHLTLAGKTMSPVLPANEIPSLLRADGFFYDEPAWSERASEFDADEMTRELNAQFERFVQVAERLPTHLDSHYHAAYFHPVSQAAMRALALQHNLPMRFGSPADNALLEGIVHPTSVRMIEHTMSLQKIIEMVQTIPDNEVTELICHPGYVDDILPTKDTWTIVRELEMGWLTNPHLRGAITEADITLCSFDIFKTLPRS